MKNSYTQLPKDYKEVRVVDLKNNKKEFWLINIGSIFLIAPFIIFFIMINDSSYDIVITILAIVAILVVVSIHELIHGIFFKVFGKEKLKFGFHGFAVSCAMPTHYFNKKAYIIIGLAPLVILSIITGVLSFLLYNTDYFLLAYAPFALNFSGSIGDIYVVGILLKSNRTVFVQDKGVSMKFYDVN